VEEYESGEGDAGPSAPMSPPGLHDEADEIGRTYMTVSQTANEKAHHEMHHHLNP